VSLSSLQKSLVWICKIEIISETLASITIFSSFYLSSGCRNVALYIFFTAIWAKNFLMKAGLESNCLAPEVWDFESR